MATDPEQEPGFGIGAVSRLTGIPLDTLRVWERRYRLVAPLRTEDNKRQYSRADVARLSLIKQLVDLGHAISAVAPLGEDALRERLHVHQDRQQPPAPAAGRPLRVLLQGDALPFLAAPWKNEWEGIEVVGSHVSYADFEKDAIGQKPDVLVVEMPALQAERVAQLQPLAARCGAGRTVVVYGFGMKSLLERLRRDGIATLRAPVTAQALAQACRAEARPLAAPAGVEAVAAIPPRRFGDADLSAVTRMPTAVRCECPQHLADLLFRLNAFEAYSADCENRNEDDAALHAHLHRETAKARALLEEALAHLIRCEAIDLAALQALA